VRDYLNGGTWSLIGEFTEVESGKRNKRPELEKALAVCKRQKAKLVIAKLDRLGTSRRSSVRSNQAALASHRGIARSLNAPGVATARGGQWTAVQVGSILRRV